MRMKPKSIEAEEHMLAFAVGGEQAVARVRLVLVACIFVILAFQLVYYHALNPDLLTGFGVAGVALILTFAFYLLARHSRFHLWLPYVTSVSDVTLVSAALATFLVLNEPFIAVNNRVIWGIYLLAISATALRPRRGIVIPVTLIAIGEYFTIMLYADLHWNLTNSDFIAVGYSYFDWFSQVGRMILMGVTGVLAAVLVKRVSHISHLAGTDSLTGVFNRTYFNLHFAEEMQRAHRYHHPLSLAIVDIDNFKAINDALGHNFGDKVLILITLRLKRGLRASDILFRHGGDELAIMMPETSAHDAHQVLTRIVEAMRTIRLKDHPLTVSVGIATWPEDAHNGPALVRVADDHLYAAKKNGRNCIVGSTAARYQPQP